jgi:hypothetical protein
MTNFDKTRLHPHRIIAAMNRRLRELPHYFAWYWSSLGKRNQHQLEQFRNIHAGETLYLLANGPSINLTPWNRLKGERVMCMNRFYIKFPELEFTPDYLVCIEETVLNRFSKDFGQLKLPVFVNWRCRTHIKNVLYLKESFDIHPKFQPDIIHPANACGTVTCMCLQLAYFMGFQRVVLLGLDHSFKEQGLAGKTVVRTDEKDESHFDPNYFPKGMKWVMPDLVKSELGYAMARDHYAQNQRSILDATEGGKCTIFEKVKLENL